MKNCMKNASRYRLAFFLIIMTIMIVVKAGEGIRTLDIYLGKVALYH